jgi:hypothetical protein
MAALKIAQLRSTLDAFAVLYKNSQFSERAEALRAVSLALAKADKLSVDDVIRALENNGGHTPSQRNLKSEH